MCMCVYIHVCIHLADCFLFLPLDFLPQSTLSLPPSLISTMKSITVFAIIALAATTWAASPSGEFNIHAYVLTAICSTFSNYRMLKSEENLKVNSLDLSH